MGALLGAALVLGVAGIGQAQTTGPGAEVKAFTGRVEILRQGQTQWIPATVGAKLVEGDDIRAFAGASAELELIDGTTLFLAENSRIKVAKLEYEQGQRKMALFHLAVGKVRAVISQAAVTLVRGRQSNFAISTPTAVAAARGTKVWVSYNPGPNKTLIAVEPEELPADDAKPDPKRTSEALEGRPVQQRAEQRR
jgi:hypothetical protein